ncbi:MAG: hypothetical protein IPP59_05595 [Betaproteobacteria bacterium]|nr:hypothetical protein [Candidatus Dechloromonas phosphorivorans]
MQPLGSMMVVLTQQMPELGWRLLADALANIQICLAIRHGPAMLQAQEGTQQLFASLRHAPGARLLSEHPRPFRAGGDRLATGFLIKCQLGDAWVLAVFRRACWLGGSPVLPSVKSPHELARPQRKTRSLRKADAP